jgi:predicted PurR-regulated permease PerM
LQVLSAERLKGERKRNLEDKMLKTNLTTAKFQFVISIFSLLVAVVAIIAPILIKDDKPTQVNIPEMKQIIETQKSLKENISDLQHKILIVDTIKDQQ